MKFELFNAIVKQFFLKKWVRCAARVLYTRRERFVGILLIGQVVAASYHFELLFVHSNTLKLPYTPKSSHRTLYIEAQQQHSMRYVSGFIINKPWTCVCVYLCDNVNESGWWMVQVTANVYVDTNQCLDINVTVKSIMTLLYPVLIVSVYTCSRWRRWRTYICIADACGQGRVQVCSCVQFIVSVCLSAIVCNALSKHNILQRQIWVTELNIDFVLHRTLNRHTNEQGYIRFVLQIFDVACPFILN